MITEPAHFSRAIIDVERAMFDLRRGLPVCIANGKNNITVASAEVAGTKPTTKSEHAALLNAAVLLAKHASLLPQVSVVKTSKNALRVRAADIRAYKKETAMRLTKVSEARVPLVYAEDARVIAFRPAGSLVEHLAIVVGKPEKQAAPLVRLHSSCITGDILGSLRCDCGDQLHSALETMSTKGGVVLYLNQEGRGIGIANKLRAYALQDGGMDTVEANLALGFGADERTFLAAAQILKKLKIKKIQLLTNNPDKVAALEKLGIEVVKRVPLVIKSSKHNARYLDTKAKKCGHLF